jgi:hypothetical protein
LAFAALVVLTLALALVMVTRYQAAIGLHAVSAQSGSRVAELSVERPGAGRPHVGYWSDSVNGTSYTAGLIPNSDGFSSFEFTVPGGGDVSAFLRLTPQADGSYVQQTPVQAVGNIAAGPTTRPVCLPGTLASDKSQDIYYEFFGHFSGDGLAAYGTFSYVLASDKIGIREFCTDNQTQGQGITTYNLSAGCTPTSCQDLISQIGPSVATYDSDVINADWNDAYGLASEQITDQYSQAEFSDLLNQQTASTGKITAISPPLTTPVVQFTPEYQAYFAAQQTVTVDDKGAMSTQTLTNYYILENGSWLFWFSG